MAVELIDRADALTTIPLRDAELLADKQERLSRYLTLSQETRKRRISTAAAGSTFIHPFCGRARVHAQGSATEYMGTAVLAYKKSIEYDSAFTALHIADVSAEGLAETEKALLNASAIVRSYHGEAIRTVPFIVSTVNKRAHHFALLDPSTPEQMPFSILQSLGDLHNVEILIHLNVQNLHRNIERYMKTKRCALDDFVPGWRSATMNASSPEEIRQRILEHWLDLIRSLNFRRAEGREIMLAGREQTPVWFAYAARHEDTAGYWKKMRDISPQRSFSLDEEAPGQ